MLLCGIQKTTLLDYPGLVAATIFTGGCNFRCPFCHNGNLIKPSYSISEEEVFSVLAKRRNILEGVCITGGEPTIQEDLLPFIETIKDMGYSVKLDTNGYKPDQLIALCNSGLVDYVAMDIKSCKKDYSFVSGIAKFNIDYIEKSVSFLINGTIPYEFRTTVTKEFHTPESIEQIGVWLAGTHHYYLQNYKDSDYILQPGLHGFDASELKMLAALLKPLIPNTHIRGLDVSM